MSQAPFSIRRTLDRYGILLAGMCAAHCITTIVVVSVAGVGSHFLLAPEIHEIGLAIAFVFAALAIGWGALTHRNMVPTLLAIAGLGLMGLALMIGHGTAEVMLTISGVALVAAGHVMNLRVPA